MHRNIFPFSPAYTAHEVQRNQCSILRCWQGWTSLSTTGVGEGTLRVLPMLSLATAYIMLRPFFCPGTAGGEWELDLESNSFPGSVPGKTQELNEETHPHLRLGKTMTSVPKIQPGDQVYCMYSLLLSLHFLSTCRMQGTAMSYTLLKGFTVDKRIRQFSTFLPSRFP